MAAKEAVKRRVLLVGWDSADWQIIQPLVDAGKLPVLQRLIETGVSGRLASLEPMISPLLWTSIATGKRAHAHGIYSFTTSDLEKGKVESVGSHHRTCHALWNILHHHGRRSLVCNWFASHPAEPVEGLVISNEFSVHRPTANGWDRAPQSSVSPADHWERLEELRVTPADIDASVIKLLVPRAGEVDQENDARLARLAALLAENFNVHAAFTHGMEAVEWDFAAVYYEAIDLAAHYFMKYVAPVAPGVSRSDSDIYGEIVEGVYRLHDAMLGRLLALAGPETVTMIVSDHGFHSRDRRPAPVPDGALALTRWHRRQGILVMHGPGVRKDELIYGAGLLDVTPTVLTLFGIPVGEDMHGRVLAEALEKPPQVSTIPSWEAVKGDFGRVTHGTEEAISGHLLQRFIDLGYLAPGSGTDPNEVLKQWRSEQHFRALALLDAQRIEDALPILDELHEAEPERDDLAHALATVLLQLGLVEEAEEVVELIEKTTTLPAAMQLRADLEWRRGNRQACLAALAAAEKAAGESVVTLNLAGALYLQLRQYASAEAVFTRSLAIEEENPSALSGLSFCRSSQGRHREAADLALEGISLLFHHFYSHYCYGIALAHLGEREASIRAFENTLRFQPRFHQARRYLIHLLKHHPSAQPLVEQHRSILLQRSMDHMRSDFRRRALRKDLQTARQIRAAARNAKRAAALEREKLLRESPALELLIVSGLPRSGTSLVMQMLEAAGIPIMTDGRRAADEDNPQGYYEWEEIKELQKDPHLIAAAAGSAVKVVSPLLPCLPRKHRYKIVFVRRALEATILSQNRMRLRLTAAPPGNFEATRLQTEKHLDETFRLLRAAPNVECIEVRFEQLLEKSESEIRRLAEFCGITANSIAAMQAVVKPR